MVIVSACGLVVVAYCVVCSFVQLFWFGLFVLLWFVVVGWQLICYYLVLELLWCCGFLLVLYIAVLDFLLPLLVGCLGVMFALCDLVSSGFWFVCWLKRFDGSCVCWFV